VEASAKEGRDGRTDGTGTGIFNKNERKRQQVKQEPGNPTTEEKKGKEGRRGRPSASCPFLFLLLLLLLLIPSSSLQQHHSTPLALFLIPSFHPVLRFSLPLQDQSKVGEEGIQVVIACFSFLFFFLYNTV